MTSVLFLSMTPLAVRTRMHEYASSDYPLLSAAAHPVKQTATTMRGLNT